MVRRLLNSHEYKRSLATPFNLYSMSGFLDGVRMGRSSGAVEKVLEDVEDLDLEAVEKYQPLYDKLFMMEYPYVQKVSRTCHRSFKFLMEIF